MADSSSRRHDRAAYSVAGHTQGLSDADERMERYQASVGRRRVERRVWPGAAFIVEALLLLVFLTGSLAVLMALNGEADRACRENDALLEAITMASNAAESFAADPRGFEQAAEAGTLDDRWFSRPLDEVGNGEMTLHMSCYFTSQAKEGGVLHEVRIEVWQERMSENATVRDAEGFEEEGARLERWDDEPVFALDTAAYVPDGTASPTDAGAGGADADGGAAGESVAREVSHG